MPNDNRSIAILVIDDHVLMRQSLQDILTMAGYNVVLAASAREGLRLLSAAEPHLIITDMLLPDMDGLQLYQQVHTSDRWQHAPFIFISGSREKLKAVQAQSAPTVIACLPKPFAIQDLLNAVERATAAGSAG